MLKYYKVKETKAAIIIIIIITFIIIYCNSFIKLNGIYLKKMICTMKLYIINNIDM